MIIYGNELYHHGIAGQKWGIRRFQYKDGTYTQAGKERKQKERKDYSGKINSAFKPGKDGKASAAEKAARNVQDIVTTIQGTRNSYKSKTQRTKRYEEIKKMSDKELQEKINRLQKEKQLNDLLNDRESVRSGKSVLDDILDIAVPVVGIGASAVTIYAQLYKIKHEL